jgi:hypothetical protein
LPSIIAPSPGDSRAETRCSSAASVSDARNNSQNENRGSLFDFDQTASLTYSSAGASKVRKPFLKNALPGNRKSR